MRRFLRQTRYILIGLLLALPILLGVATAHAQSFRSGNNVTLASGHTVDETLFAWGRTIDIAGDVDGDIFCAGQNITISGTVHGDVICAGQNIVVSGTVKGNIRVAGQDVTISGPVSGNLTAAGQTITTQTEATVGGDATVAGQNALLNGAIGRDLASASQETTINAKVGRNVKATVERLSLGSSALVNGDINYTSSKDLTRMTGAVIHGTVTRNAPKTAAHHFRAGALLGFSLLMALYVLLSLLLVELVLVLLLPRMFHSAAEHARRRLLSTFLIGLVTSIVVPVVLVALLFTVVGIPLALLGGLVWLLMVVLSGPFSAYLLGRLLLQDSTNNAIWTMLLGGAVLLVLYFIPFLGVLTTLLSLWFGLGTILQQIGRLPRPRYHQPAAKP